MTGIDEQKDILKKNDNKAKTYKKQKQKFNTYLPNFQTFEHIIF